MFCIFNGQTRGLGESPQLEIFLNIGVKFRQYLHHFKGADLHVFLSILLHADDRGWSSPSLKQIKQETGYENSTISASLTRLCDTKIDGKRLLFAMQERTKGKFQKNSYLIFPSDEEITLHGKETRKPRVSNSPSTEKPSTVEPNSENQRDGINHAWEEPVVEEDKSFSGEKDLQSANADVPSAPSQPQSSDGRNSRTTADVPHTDDALEERIPDLPKSSAKKVSTEIAPTVKRAPLPHIGVIEAFLEPFLKDLPPDFKIGSCARVGMDLVKAGVTIDTMREAGLLYRAWYDATPGHQPSQLSWTVAGVTNAIRTALSLVKAGIGGSQVHAFLAMRYTDPFWQDKTVSWKHVGEQIGRWLAKSSTVSDVPAIEMDENGMPVGYREMQEARRRADAIVAEKRRNGELR